MKLLAKLRYGINLRKPRYMARLAANVVKRRLLGRYPLRGVDFSVSYACNLKCAHCFNKSMEGSGRRMELEDYARVIREAEALGAINFAFQGGEFLALKEYPRYLALVDSRRNSLSITTNGYYLDDVNVAKLRAAGVNTVTVSLDSGIAAEHNAFRGDGESFERAMEGIERARAAGLKVVINTYVSRENLRSEGLHRLVDYVEANELLVNTIFATPSGVSDGEASILQESDIGFYRQSYGGKAHVIRDTQSGYAVGGCQAATETLYINPYGDVLPCPYIHIRAGNVLEEPLARIRERAMGYFHYQPQCLISENRGFVREYVALTRGKSLPLKEDQLDGIRSWDR